MPVRTVRTRREPVWRHLLADLVTGILLVDAYLLARRVRRSGRRAAQGERVRHEPKVRLNRLRPFNKHILNPVVLAFSGRRGIFFGIVRHRGRRSGRVYSTPLAPLPVPGGFLFVTPYGPGVDWCRNILAASGCEIRWHGKSYIADRPRLLSLGEAAPLLPRPVLWVARLVGIDTVLKVHTVPSHG